MYIIYICVYIYICIYIYMIIYVHTSKHMWFKTYLSGIQCGWDWVLRYLKVLLPSLQMRNTLYGKFCTFWDLTHWEEGFVVAFWTVVLHQLSEGTPGHFCISYISCSRLSVMTFTAPPWEVSRLCMMQRIWAMCRSFVCCWTLACAWIFGFCLIDYIWQDWYMMSIMNHCDNHCDGFL